MAATVPAIAGVKVTTDVDTITDEVKNLSVVDANVEGVRDDRFRSPRLQTISKFENQFKFSNVILLRAPPGSGKTSFGFLYHDWLTNKRIASYLISLLGITSTKMSDGPEQSNEYLSSHFKTKCGRDWRDIVTNVTAVTYIIIDETQLIYGRRAESFWQFVKELQQQQSNIRLLLMAAYGESRTSYPGDVTGTPIEFTEGQTIESAQFGLARQEFDEISRHYHLTAESPRAPLPVQIIEMIWTATGGHAGLARRALREVRNRHYCCHPAQLPADTDTITKYMLSTKFVNDMETSRSLPSCDLSSADTQVLLQVLHSPINAYEPEVIDKVAVKNLILAGYLVRNKKLVQFSSPVLRTLVHRRIHSAQSDMFGVPFASFDDFIRRVIGGMRKAQLALTHSIGTDNSVTEYLWQSEFYRSACGILPKGQSISPEISRIYARVEDKEVKVSVGRDRLDFYINGDKNWGIELLREGRGLEDHVDRFEPKGRYFGLQLSQWAVIDFRNRRRQSALINKPHVWHVIYDDDFTGAVVTHNGSTTPIRFAI